MLGTQYSGKMVGQIKSKTRVLKISPLPQQGIPPHGVRFFGGCEARDSADAGRLFFIYRKNFGSVRLT